MAVSRETTLFGIGELTLTIRKHVISDLRPYVCTHRSCAKAGKPFDSLSLFSFHERFAHGSPEDCVFCGEVLSRAIRREWVRHLGRHMEEIAFMIVTKPYEDWDFYSDASSVNYQGKHNYSTSHDDLPAVD